MRPFVLYERGAFGTRGSLVDTSKLANGAHACGAIQDALNCYVTWLAYRGEGRPDRGAGMGLRPIPQHGLRPADLASADHV